MKEERFDFETIEAFNAGQIEFLAALRQRQPWNGIMIEGCDWKWRPVTERDFRQGNRPSISVWVETAL